MVGLLTDKSQLPAISSDHDGPLVHNWGVTRLTCLGIPAVLAEAYADRLDWHKVAELVHCACPPSC